jgi:TrmH family RNA methyltransferase
VPAPLGTHSPKLAEVRALLTKRGREEARRFTFEGATLLAEALESGAPPEELYATQAAWDGLGALRDRLACPVFIVDARAAGRLSDLETPPGIVAVAKTRLHPPGAVLAGGSPALLLAGVGDPGNAGTLLRSAEIFGFGTVIFGSGGVEPYNPKVVRGSMGAIFRLMLGVASPAELDEAARQHGYAVIAADRTGEPLANFPFGERPIVAIGNERRGTAGWLARTDRTVAIPQTGRGESLNAAVAGSIVMYEFARCQARS